MHASRPAYDPHCLQRHILEHLVLNTIIFLCVYVMGDTAQSRMHASRPAYDPHCLQRHILEHLVPNTNAMQPADGLIVLRII